MLQGRRIVNTVMKSGIEDDDIQTVLRKGKPVKFGLYGRNGLKVVATGTQAVSLINQQVHGKNGMASQCKLIGEPAIARTDIGYRLGGAEHPCGNVEQMVKGGCPLRPHFGVLTGLVMKGKLPVVVRVAAATPFPPSNRLVVSDKAGKILLPFWQEKAPDPVHLTKVQLFGWTG